jgi:hypothetical protein
MWQVTDMAYFSTLKTMHNVSPKRQLDFNGLHSVISQKVELSMLNATLYGVIKTSYKKQPRNCCYISSLQVGQLCYLVSLSKCLNIHEVVSYKEITNLQM